MSILALSGSFRTQSVNTAALRTLADLGVPLTVYDYTDVPLYNGDIEVPASVGALKQAIESASGVIIATPEFNYSVPGVLKNALDWASRPAYNSCFRGKPVAVLSASPSALGGARAQQHLKTILIGMNAQIFAWPEVAIAKAHQQIAEGRITDPQTREVLRDFGEHFVSWAAAVPTF
jgi:chromate reductase